MVADEIRDLAERTQASTDVISDQIQAVQEEAQNAVQAVDRGSVRIQEGAKLSERAGEALREILDSSKQTLDMAKRISEFMAEQSLKLIDCGVRIIGGCCGTTPEHIAALRKTVDAPSGS